MKKLLLLCLTVALPMRMFADVPPSKPNIIFILADNMGYGDIGPFDSPESK